jgi:hypothetical protein
MKTAVKKLWVEALRSGEYKQGKKCLRTQDNKFCCLGVLCNLHAQAHPKAAASQTNPLSYLGDWQWPAWDVCEWAGLPHRYVSVTIDGKTTRLADHNDGCGTKPKTFAQIADAIEAQL